MVRRKSHLLLAASLLGLVACAGDTSQPFPRSTLLDPEIPRAKPLDAPLPTGTVPTALVTTTATPPRPAPELRYGTEASSQTPPRQQAVVTDPNGISLNFADAEITSVLASVLGDVLKLNYAVDPRVQGRITLQTSTPLARESVLPALEGVLRANGVALIRNGALIQVAPAEGARLGDAAAGRGREAGWRTQVVPLRHANAAALQKALEGLAPQGTTVRAEPQSNALILTGSGGDIGTLLDTVDLFDVDTMRGKSFGLFRLQRTDPRTLIDELDLIFHADPKQASTANGVRFVPIERLNAVLAIARTPDTLRQANDWIARLDRPADSNDAQLHVYKVVSGRASYLAEVLSKLYPEHSVEKVGRERGQPVDPSGGQGGGQGGGFGNPGLAPGFSQPPGGGLGTMVNADASANGSLIPGPGGQSAGGTAPSPDAAGNRPPEAAGAAPDERMATGPQQRRDRPSSGARIVADTSSNALLVLARPAVYAQIEQTLRRLDVVPSQVMIEVTIAEVRLNDALRFGVQYFISEGKFRARFTSDPTGVVGPRSPGFSFGLQTSQSQVILDALKSITDVSILSTPTLLVLDNQTARLQVGDQVPTVTAQSRSVIQPDAPLVNQVQLKDTGVILAVTPRITGSGQVLLDVWQEVSDVRQTTSSNIDSPTFQRRRLESSVSVGDTETVALGGLIRHNRARDRSGIPELSEVPVVGWLFGSRGDAVDRTELLIMITPRIVRNTVEARGVTEELRQRLSDRPAMRPAVLP